jgi:hypothetical protein
MCQRDHVPGGGVLIGYARQMPASGAIVSDTSRLAEGREQGARGLKDFEAVCDKWWWRM